MFNHIYYVNQNRFHSIHLIQNRLWEVISGFTRSFAKKPFQEARLREFLAKSIAWYFALVQKLGIDDVETLLFDKYPYCCPYCLAVPCGCPAQRPALNLDELHMKVNTNASLKPRTFDDWQQMFNKIYVKRNSLLEGPELMGKLLEEIGELIESIRIHRNDSSNVNWRNELADMFAWIIGATNYVNSNFTGVVKQPISVGRVTFEKYPNKCSTCEHNPCDCKYDLAFERFSEPGPYLPIESLNTVFIVHGRDYTTRDAVDLFLRKELKLETIVLENEPNKGRTILEKFLQEAARVFAAVVILTPDDELLKNGDHQKLARQNVMFEMGYFCSYLGRERVILLHQNEVKIPSDLLGLAYIGFDKFDSDAGLKLMKEFEQIRKSKT